MKLQTPVGKFDFAPGVADRLIAMSDRQVADEAFRTQHVEPFAFQVLVDRGLCFRGDMKSDIYKRIEERELAAA